ncbi:hypothetical protein CMQ_6809 [Grosmannia clavigera kw1407]|uniref:Sad1 interacting factor 1 n=1 Tax=Grosmannia clavigera (strain kw1407 / UAMH 11150) TaxID=655863 RepID=F0X7Z2_GROCL|nr:uncharacterized protein CMQ_6809 [Grosmannia clavigera kw1407]EFX06488.1 hypothetical protein CMQ_6809 [Grosmannia clavigera kw1407]
MTESAAPESAAPDQDAAAAARLAEARKRKERREAKIKAGGSSRLNTISSLGGGLQREEPRAVPKAEAKTPGDPDEIDISEHFYEPTTTARPQATAGGAGVSEADAQLLELLGQSQSAGKDGLPENDPMAAMLAQMMQSMGGPGGPGGPGLGGGGWPPTMPPMGQQPKAAVPSASAALWRLVHFAVAVALGLYVALSTPFAGTRIEREQSQAAQEAVGSLDGLHGMDGAAGLDDYDSVQRRYFFYGFATAETVLLTSRFFLERQGGGGLWGSSSGSGGGGLLSMALGFAPPAVRRSVDVGLRYWQIFSTVRSDLLVCVFVLGVCSWVRG